MSGAAAAPGQGRSLCAAPGRACACARRPDMALSCAEVLSVPPAAAAPTETPGFMVRPGLHNCTRPGSLQWPVQFGHRYKSCEYVKRGHNLEDNI